MGIDIPPHVVQILIEIGESGDPNDATTATHLEAMIGYDAINRAPWSTWDLITHSMDTDDLIALTQGLVWAVKNLVLQG